MHSASRGLTVHGEQHVQTWMRQDKRYKKVFFKQSAVHAVLHWRQPSQQQQQQQQ
jgi:hypothetical protein